MCYARILEAGERTMQFAVGFKVHGKTGHVVVDGEDALIAALKVKIERPDACITYVRHPNKRGDSRHPAHDLADAEA
jgi:hypothetical protein